jgi:hypothetical protein
MNTRRLITRILLLLLLIPTSAFAHEMWVFSIDIVRAWSEKSLPSTYTSFTLPTVLVVAIALVINAVLFQLHRSGAGEMFPLFRVRVRSMRPYTAVVLAGSNFLFLAIYFKVMHPNLMLAIIDVHELPILGLRPEVIVLIIPAVEVSIGVLVIFGILLRFLSVVLIAAFIFFAICIQLPRH